MDLTGLSKEERKRHLIANVKSKNSMRKQFYLDAAIISDQDLEDFFDKVYDRIDHISDSPTFHFSEVVNGKIIQKSVQTVTISYQTLDDLKDFLQNDAQIESSLTFFYDIIKKTDESVNFRFANVLDGPRRIREERNKKIDDVLNIINKPR